MTNLEKRYINIRFLFSFVHSQNLEIKRKKKVAWVCGTFRCSL